jgi:hypothetical protein
MARTCLHYLSFNIFEVGLESDMIKQNILSGSYRLHWFAVTQWLGLIQRCASLLCNRSIPGDLIFALNRFVYECGNGNYDAREDLDSQQNDEFQIFKENAPDTHRLLHQELQYHYMDVGTWKLEEDKGILEPVPFNCKKGKICSANKASCFRRLVEKSRSISPIIRFTWHLSALRIPSVPGRKPHG